MTIDDDVDTELHEAKSKLRNAYKIISSEKNKLDSVADFTSVFENLHMNRSFVVGTYYTTHNELEALKDNSEIKMLYDRLEQAFFEYSQAYAKRKRDSMEQH
jgi:hypothetical protein